MRHHLPRPNFKLDKLKPMFGSHGLSYGSGCAISRFSGRIYNFKSKSKIDPTLNVAHARQLRKLCSENVDPRMAIDMDPATPRTFDNMDYRNLQQGKGLFTSDQCLFTDARSRHIVNIFASNNTAFEEAFVTAITKLDG
ncbi:hypothetical protein CRYUN_Cryun03dG0059500 [Craigia yunnanensis]